MMNYEQADPMASGATEQPATDDTENQLTSASLAKNLAEDASEDTLTALGSLCKQEFENDYQSRTTWEDNLRGWEELAMQVKEDKSFPWPGAANASAAPRCRGPADGWHRVSL